MPNPRVLVVEDDPALCRLLEISLSQHGFHVIVAGSGQQGIRLFREQPVDLVLLDIMLPGLDGYEVCRRLRQESQVPIIIMTALSSAEQVVRGLDAGADDYITKPFAQEVLLARCRAALRRAQAHRVEPDGPGYRDNYLELDMAQRRVWVQGKVVHLSPIEYQLLATLVRRPGEIVTYEQILEDVWGLEGRSWAEYIHTYVARLRRKLERDHRQPRYILTEPRTGYRFEPQTRPGLGSIADAESPEAPR